MAHEAVATTDDTKMPVRTKMRSEALYANLDPGIRFAVRVLHAGGFETCQSCEGGDGHAYDRPTVDLLSGPDDAAGFGAVACLVSYGLPVYDVSLVWPLDHHGFPYERLWRITFWRTMEDRADEQPMFTSAYFANAEGAP